MTKTEIQASLRDAVTAVKADNPMAASITNTVTIELVANAQLAVGGSAAMVYLPDEGEGMAAAGDAMYINMGTLLPVYEETLPRTVKALRDAGKPWVLDPVGIGLGALRLKLLQSFKDYKPAVIRGNASEIIALANLWELLEEPQTAGVRGVDATDSVDDAQEAAVALAQWTGGAVAVSGPIDLVTDGQQTARIRGGSKFLPLITGGGCSLGGVTAIYLTRSTPFIAALAGTIVYDLAGARAEKGAAGPASFQTRFIDELYRANAAEIAAYSFQLEDE